VPFVVMVLVVALLAVAQFRWLAELGSASRLRLERDLRVAVQTATAELSLATTRLGSQLERSSADPTARAAAWDDWRRRVPDFAPLYRQDSVRLEVDPRFAVDSLLPRLARRVAALAELEVGLVLARRGPGGAESIMARHGSVGSGPPDVEARLPLVGWQQRAMFRSREPGTVGTAPAPESFSWEVRADSSALALSVPDQDWTLRAWSERGSLERSVERIRRRNVLLATLLIVVLAGSAVVTLGALRRHERLAADRATVLAGIAHEVRTPIAVIRSAADNLANGVVSEPERIREYGQLVEREVDRLEGDVEAALAFAVAAGPGGAAADTVDLLELVRDVREASEAPERVTIEGTAAVECRADRRTLAVAIRNLVANALAYSPVDQPVLVRVERRDDQAEVVVLDRGPGIEQADRSRVFEPFVRGAAGAASGRPGLGLGLALARRIATRHEGSLVAVDRAGGGTTLRFRIPIR